MSTISWTTVDHDTIERMIAVGLCRRHKEARRIKPSQGDGGLDILVPVPGGSQLDVEVYQVKKFADVLNPSRERQIKKSLVSAIETHRDTTFGYRISKWHLALPMELTREQEKWLYNLADSLESPFPVSVFGLTQIESLLLGAPEIREYYIGDGMDRLRTLFVQMSNLNGIHNPEALAADPLSIKPADVTSALGDLHRNLNAADPHFDYDFQVTNDHPELQAVQNRIASVVSREDPNAPYITWHVATKYDSALEDRSIPGGYTVYPQRMTPEQRAAWERWQTYGTPVELEGDVVGGIHIDLPGGLGGPLLEPGHVLRLGPAADDLNADPVGRSRWVIEDSSGAAVAEQLFKFHLVGRGLAGGEHRKGADEHGYLSVDLFARPGETSESLLKVELHAEGARWEGQPVQRVAPAIRFAAAWSRGNFLRPTDEFGLAISPEAYEFHSESPVPMAAVEAVEDLVRISSATRRPIALPGNIISMARDQGVGLRIIADTVSGLEPMVGVGDLVLWHEDAPAAREQLDVKAEEGTLTVPWDIPFGLFGDDYKFLFTLEVIGRVELEPVESTGLAAERGLKSLRVVTSESTRARMRWQQNRP